jgi:molybdopterin converting factor small subunit
MQVNIIIFGQLTDITNAAQFSLEDVADTNELTKRLHASYPALGSSRYVMAVDKKIVDENTALTNNVTVALMPPFSGG